MRAMLAAPHGYVLRIQHYGDLSRICLSNVEREYYTSLVMCRPDYADSAFQLLGDCHVKLPLMLPDTVHSYFLQVSYCRRKSYRARIVLQARLKLLGRLEEFMCVVCGAFDRVAACHERAQLLKRVLFSIKHADARPEHLVPGERCEIYAKLLDIDFCMWRALRRVYHRQRSMVVGNLCDLPHRQRGAVNV